MRRAVHSFGRCVSRNAIKRGGGRSLPQVIHDANTTETLIHQLDVYGGLGTTAFAETVPSLSIQFKKD